MVGEVRLFLWDHPAGKRKVKRPGCTDQPVEQPSVRLHIEKQAEPSIGSDNHEAVERKKIGCKRNPKIVPIGHDMTSFPTHSKAADPSTHEQDPQSMGEFMSENVNHRRAGKAEERNQPQNCA